MSRSSCSISLQDPELPRSGSVFSFYESELSLSDPDSQTGYGGETPRSIRVLKQTDSTFHSSLVDVVSLVSKSLTCRRFLHRFCELISFSPSGCVWNCHIEQVGATSGEGHAAGDRHKSGHVKLRGKYDLTVRCVSLPEDSIGFFAVELFINVDTGGSQKEVDKMKELADMVYYNLKKELVKREFPDFPEGNSNRPFSEVYQLNEQIKAGAFGKVLRGTHRESGKCVAIKCVQRKKLKPQDDAAIFVEVSVMASLDHPNSVKLIDFFIEVDWYIMVMEFMSGGDLFDRIGSKKCYSESDARKLCRHVLNAVAHFHDAGVAHRDLKPKNLLLVSREDDSFIKIADFGFATRVFAPKSLTRSCGTPFYVAPEVLKKNRYDDKSDMWSVGVILYLILSGSLPFMAPNLKTLFKLISKGECTYDGRHWFQVSKEARMLVKALLVTDPNRRLSAKEALENNWFLMDGRILSQRNLSESAKRLKTFDATIQMKAAICAVKFKNRLKVLSSNLAELNYENHKTEQDTTEEADTTNGDNN